MGDAEIGNVVHDVPKETAVLTQRSTQSPGQIAAEAQSAPQQGYNNVTTSPPPQPQPGYSYTPTQLMPQPGYNNVTTSPLPPPQPSYNNMILSPPVPSYNMTTSQQYQQQPNRGNGAPPPQPPSYDSHNADPAPITDQYPYATYNEKSVLETYLFAVSPFGLLGAHHFYLQRYYWGIVYFFTLGLLGCGYLIDWFRVPCLVKQANEKIKNQRKDEKSISDAYTLWFPMGLLGFHHYYLENYAWGVLYTCTLGLGGIGWIVDAFRMPRLVRAANERRHVIDVEKKNTCLAVALMVSPFGILGAHHYYLNRPIWGMLYTFTLGLGGIGWVVDWFRIPVLLKRTNKAIMERSSDNMKTVDDAYVLWFPFGLLGLHHFYLERPLWGVLYFFSLGLGGLGWLIDLVAIPWYVKEVNLKIRSEQDRRALVSGTNGPTSGVPPYVSVTQSIQGYFNYGSAYPATSTPTNATWPNAHQDNYGYNYQQGGGYFPQTSQKEASNNFVYPTGTYYPTGNHAIVGDPQMNGVPPPPYKSSEPSHEDGSLPQ